MCSIESCARMLSRRVGQDNACFRASGSTAIEAALDLLGVGTGDEVVVPNIGCASVPAAVARSGATLVFVGVGEELTLSPRDVGAAITPSTRAVIGVHLYGLPCDIRGIRDVVPDGVAVIEDFAQAWGLEGRGEVAGSQGDVAVTSFGPTKPLSLGAGGAVFCSADLLDRYAAIGGIDIRPPNEAPVSARFPQSLFLGIPYALDSADLSLRARREAVVQILESLAAVDARTPPIDTDYLPSWTRLPLYVDDVPSAIRSLESSPFAALVQPMHLTLLSSLPMFDQLPKRLVKGSVRTREPILVKPIDWRLDA